MEFYVFDLQFDFLGVIDDYVSIPINRSYVKKTSFDIEVSPTESNINLLKKDRLIAKKDDLQHAYIIETIGYTDGVQNNLVATVFSLHHLLKRRIVLGQQSFSGTIGSVMSSFVNKNAVTPTNPNRVIPGLVNGVNNDFGPTTNEGCSYKQLDDWLFEIANKYELSWDILFDYNNKQFVFTVWEGVDRSEQQDINSHVVFAKEFDNVISQNYIDSYSQYKSMAIVAGEGEGATRKIITINNPSGFERDELYVDARDLQSTYTDNEGVEVTIPTAEYDALLVERGNNKLAECRHIETLESELDFNSSFVFDEDYFLGDVVSVKNTKLGLILNTRIVESLETFSKEGRSIEVKFGSNVPTLLEKIKKMR